jgi:hypothetical protein
VGRCQEHVWEWIGIIKIAKCRMYVEVDRWVRGGLTGG